METTDNTYFHITIKILNEKLQHTKVWGVIDRVGKKFSEYVL